MLVFRLSDWPDDRGVEFAERCHPCESSVDVCPKISVYVCVCVRAFSPAGVKIKIYFSCALWPLCTSRVGQAYKIRDAITTSLFPTTDFGESVLVETEIKICCMDSVYSWFRYVG